MYYCEQCESECVVRDGENDCLVVICTECNYEVTKDYLDSVTLLEAAQEIVTDFKRYGEVLQTGDNGEYGTESAIGKLIDAINIITA